MATSEHGRQWLVMVAVVTLHALFLLGLLMRDTVQLIARGPALRDSVLFFIEDQPPAVVHEPPVLTRPPPIRYDPPRTLIQPDISGNPPPSAGSTAPPINAPTTDWSTQAAEAASAAVDKAIRQETRKCDPSEKPNSFLPPCTRREHKFEWNPNPSRVGFSGGLPYVRLGERCVVGLGFFGCGIGKKPPANGDLFEHMDDPERDRSSVPAVPAVNDPRSERPHVPSLPDPSNR